MTTTKVQTILGTFNLTIPDPAFDSDFALCVACLPPCVGAYISDDPTRVIVFYRGEYERMGIGGFSMDKDNFILAASAPYKELCNFFYPTLAELGID